MEMAKVTSKGQITIPVSIRKRLNINEGDKVLFIDTADGVMMVNPEVRPAGAGAENNADITYIGHMDSAQDAGFVNVTGGGTGILSASAGAAAGRTDAAVSASAAQKPDSARRPEPAHKPESAPPERERAPLHENQYDVNKLLDEIRSFREKY